MPLPRWLARFNRRVTNVLGRRVAGRLPSFAIVNHRGRHSSKAYRTPANAFARPGGYVFALTYGPGADWVKNVLAAGGCELEMDRKRVRLVHPRIVHDPRQQLVPALTRPILRLIGVTDFLELDIA